MLGLHSNNRRRMHGDWVVAGECGIKGEEQHKGNNCETAGPIWSSAQVALGNSDPGGPFKSPRERERMCHIARKDCCT